ncbi:MAG: anaerobic ribonucleoside-triphosphate reductase [Planctomycetota bacterium]
MGNVTAMQVRTRAGQLVEFEPRRIVNAILESMSAVGVGDVGLAEELAAAVGHFLATFRGGAIVDIDQIHDMVEKVLMETGHREVARSYIVLREKRNRVREESRARPLDVPKAQVPAVEGRRDRVATPWDRARIVRALIEEGDLEADLAREVAAAVETRAARSGLRAISTALLRELVDNELFERGHTAGLQRQTSVALPKYDLEQLLFRGGDPGRGLYPGDPVRVAQHLGTLLLRQYVMHEVHSASVAEAHLDGTIHIHELDRSLQFLRAPVQSDVLEIEGEPGETGAARAVRAAFTRVRDLLPLVSEEIEVFGLGEALVRQRAEDLFDGDRCARLLLRELYELARVMDRAPLLAPSVVLRVPFVPRLRASGGKDLFGPRSEALEDSAWMLVEVLRQALAAPDGPALLATCRLRLEVSAATFRERRFREALRFVLSRVLPEAPLGFVFLTEDADRSDPRAVAGKVTLNLARIVSECLAAGGSEADVRARLGSAIETLVRALRERAEYLARLATHPDSPLAPVRAWLPGRPGLARPGDAVEGNLGDGRSATNEAAAGDSGRPLAEFIVGVLGLDDAVAASCGEHLHESVAARAEGLRWLEFVQQQVREANAGGDARIVLEETPYVGAVRRFDRLDRERPKDDGVHEAGGTGTVSGVRFERWAPLDPLTRALHIESYRPIVRLLDRLDEATSLRADGVEVLLAFLEEFCKATDVETIRGA